MKLSIEDFSVWTELNKKTSVLESTIEDRIDYIIRKIYDMFGHKIAWWDYPGHGSRGEGGSLKDSISKNEVNFSFECESSKNFKEVVAIIEGGEWGFESSFPKRWLFEDFEDELQAGIESYEKLQKEREADALIKKTKSIAKNKQLIESAKSKLTKEELKALQKS